MFSSFRGYRLAWLMADVLAGITLSAIIIPGQIAIAHLAEMPLTVGLYGTALACLLVAVLASNRIMVMGGDSTIAPMVAAGISAVAVAGSADYVSLVIAATVLAGLLLLVIGIAKWGWISDFLSKPIITGFMAGVAITIIVDQLPGLLGLPSGQGHVLDRIAQLIPDLGDINWTTAALGVLSLAVLFGTERINRRIPGALVVLIAAIGAVALFNLSAKGVATLGDLPGGLPTLHLPELTLDNIRLVLPTSLSIVLIALAQTSATSRSSAETFGFPLDVNADIRALGTANVGSGIVGAFPINASPSGTVIVGSMGAKSQLAGLVCGGIVLSFVLFAGDVLHDLPMATLSAVLMYISVKIFKVGEMKAMYSFDRLAFALMAFTLLGVVVLGVELGVLLAIAAAIVDRTRRSARPELLLEPEMSAANVVVYRLNGPLWFGNANWFKQAMIDSLNTSDAPRALVLDMRSTDDIDYTGASVLTELAVACRQRGVALAIVHLAGLADDAMTRAGLHDKIAEDRWFESVPSAVSAVVAPAR